MFGLPSLNLLTFSASIPASLISLYVFSVARILNPSSANAFATSTTSSLSLRFTEISTVPPNGSFAPTPSCAL